MSRTWVWALIARILTSRAYVGSLIYVCVLLDEKTREREVEWEKLPQVFVNSLDEIEKQAGREIFIARTFSLDIPLTLLELSLSLESLNQKYSAWNRNFSPKIIHIFPNYTKESWLSIIRLRDIAASKCRVDNNFTVLEEESTRLVVKGGEENLIIAATPPEIKSQKDGPRVKKNFRAVTLYLRLAYFVEFYESAKSRSR